MDSSCNLNLRRRLRTGLSLAVTLGLAACATAPGPVVTAPPPAAPPEVVQAPPPQPVAPVQPTQPTAPVLSDAEITGILVAANNIDIRLAHLALTKTANPQVRSYADEMIRDHTSLNNALFSLAGRLGIRPRQSSTSQGLISSANQVGAQLAQMNGRAFDRAYINNEVQFHRQVIQAAGQVLLPAARHPQLRAAIANARPILVAHYRRAQRIMATLR